MPGVVCVQGEGLCYFDAVTTSRCFPGNRPLHPALNVTYSVFSCFLVLNEIFRLVSLKADS